METQELMEVILLMAPVLLVRLILLVAGLADLICWYSARRFGRLLYWNTVRIAEASGLIGSQWVAHDLSYDVYGDNLVRQHGQPLAIDCCRHLL